MKPAHAGRRNIMTFTTKTLAPLSLLVALPACGGSQGTHPEDMSAADHLAMAEHEEAIAAEHDDRVGGSAGMGVATPGDPGSPFIYGTDTYDPAGRHRGQAAHHEALAQEHEAAAQALESFENAQCAEFPPATRAACPLLGSVAGVEDVDGGVEITLADDINREAVLAHVRCHLAYASTQGHVGMESCPLYVEGARIEAGADPHTVVLTVSDAARVDTLRRRTRAHVLE